MATPGANLHPHASNGKSHPSGGVEALTPDRDMLIRFVDVMFRNADRRGFASFRVFKDNGRSERPVLISALRLDDHEFTELMLIAAEQAATWYEPAVFAPPVCTFKNHRNAKTDNIFEGPDLSAECDQSPNAARILLETLLGAATVVVESGGEWTNPETGEIEPKVHLHWRLKKPASTLEELATLYEARSLAARLVGADHSNISIVHPIRWPGSLHRKKTPRLARIAAIAEDNEVDLQEAVRLLREAVGEPETARPSGAGLNGTGAREASCPSAVAQALAVIPNGTDRKAHDWEYWNKAGMTIWASTNGSEEGRAAFHEWSKKSTKYDKAETDKRWDHYFRSPPTRLGFGSLVYRARQHQPGWRYENQADAGLSAAIGELIAQLMREKDEPDDNDDVVAGSDPTEPPPGSGSGSGSGAGGVPPPGAGAGTGGTGGAGAAPGSNSMNKLPFHGEVAEELLRRMDARGEELRIVADEKGEEHVWIYRGGLWSLKRSVDPWLEHQIEMTLREMKCSSASKARFVTEVRKYIERSPTIRAPGTIVWDAHGKVPTRSGLIDPLTLKLEPFKKEHFATWQIAVEYDPAAKCPLWEEMLGDYFPGYASDEREQRVVLLQDFAGTMLVDHLPKALKRALVPYGPSDTGKSSLIRALWRLFVDKPISIAIADISGPHGLEEFVRRAPWALDEAFNSSGWHVSDKSKSIISGDTLSINRKNKPLITMPICAPCIWGTNHSVKFKENTDAIVNRLLILPLKRIFDKNQLIGVAAKAKAINPAWEPDDLIHNKEKVGLLNWMLVGLKRLLERGNFVNTAEGLAALDEMKLDANPIAGFLRDCTSFNTDLMVSTVDFYAAFTGWWEETHGDKKAGLDPRWVGRNLKALAISWILQDHDVFKEDDGKRFYLGVALNKAGRAYFDAESSERFTGRFRRMSEDGNKVNKRIPDKWLELPRVVKLRTYGPPAPGSE